MTVSFRLSLVDYWHIISSRATKTLIGRCVLVLLLAAPFIGSSVALYHTKHGSKAEHILKLYFLPIVGVTYLFLISEVTLGLLLATALAAKLTPKITITISPQFCYYKAFFERKSSWRVFLALREEANYFYFVGWLRAFYIPKCAFDSRAEADAFYQTALGFWREAKGILPPALPDSPGVWPPAPRPGNSAEPGGRREG